MTAGQAPRWDGSHEPSYPLSHHHLYTSKFYARQHRYEPPVFRLGSAEEAEAFSCGKRWQRSGIEWDRSGVS